MWNETGDKLACWGIDGSKYSIFVYSRSVDTFTFYKKLIVTISSSFYTNGLFWGDYIVTIRTATDGSKSWSLNTVSTGEYTAYSSLGNSLVTTFPNIAYVSDGHFIISNREYLSLFAFGSTTAKFNIATGALNNIIYGIAVSSDGKYVFAHISSSIIEVYSISLTSGFALVNTFTTTDSAYSHLACW